MNTFSRMTLAALLSTCCTWAAADVVTFAGFNPDIYSNGDGITDGHALMTVLGQGGYDGAIINGGDPFSCDLVACPVGNAGNYFVGFNDGGLAFRLDAGKFNLSSLDFAFVLPLDVPVDFAVGQLVLTAGDGTFIARDFGAQDSDGHYGFTHWDIDPAFGMSRLSQVTFSACLYDDEHKCINPAMNQAQFALDNIVFANDVPEPGSLALVALSLGAMAAARRRARARKLA